MTIQITLERRQFRLYPTERALAKASGSRDAARLQLESQLEGRQLPYNPDDPISIEEDSLKWMVRKYSEQLMYQPLEEMQYWFTHSSGVFLEPGYPPLFYSQAGKESLSANKSAVAGVGEGIAGYLMQRYYRAHKLARPNQDYPDIVMEGNGNTYLVESKATTSSLKRIKTVLEKELIRMTIHTATCAGLDTRPVIGVLMGTVLVDELHYHCCITEVRA
ncbi:hypothetical protein H6G00_17730 [Leptolyngbya sp. FACHB-541]|uniref:hypothetical protein n=1 Tax=Leptolyngbya sp. FACHB-541 TaxID=2692810 RepID=UPI0016888787|nr:hypothetical protein [Leptolyngbya sp. FACHB-541]MBD1998448.1 hypothetical protein [Leptolyngbya sp. FACHB-541]